jgi:hypothetical protein
MRRFLLFSNDWFWVFLWVFVDGGKDKGWEIDKRRDCAKTENNEPSPQHFTLDFYEKTLPYRMIIITIIITIITKHQTERDRSQSAPSLKPVRISSVPLDLVGQWNFVLSGCNSERKMTVGRYLLSSHHNLEESPLPFSVKPS